MIRYEIDASGPLDAFQRWTQAGTRDLMDRVRVLVEGQTKARFTTETAPDGSAWAPLQPSTIASKRKNSQGILKDTGRLQGSISGTSDADEAIVGTNVFYGIFHQEGIEGDPGDATSTDLPARPFLGMGRRDLRQLRAVAQTWAEGFF